jgi:hypothetical protein
MATYKIKANDLLPLLELTLYDEDVVAVDLTNATSVRLFVLNKTNVELVDKISSTDAELTFTAAGVVTYAWQAAETLTPTNLKLIVEVLWASGKYQRFPTQGYAHGKIVPRIAGA